MRNTLVIALLAVTLLPFASASMTVPGGYVSTAPLVVDDAVMIRSSATFDGTSPPMVRAYGENGTVRWAIEGVAPNHRVRTRYPVRMCRLKIIHSGASSMSHIAQYHAEHFFFSPSSSSFAPGSTKGPRVGARFFASGASRVFFSVASSAALARVVRRRVDDDMSVRDDEDGRRGSSSQSAFVEVVGEDARVRPRVRVCRGPRLSLF